MCWYHPGLHWPGEFSGIAWQSETFERGFTPPAPDAGLQGCWTFDDQRSRSPWCRKDCTCRCTSPSQSLDKTTTTQWIHFFHGGCCSGMWIHWILLAQGEEYVVSTGRYIFFGAPRARARFLLAMLRAMMEQDDGARMVDNVGLEQLVHWKSLGKQPKSRDKQKCLSYPGSMVFGDFGHHLQVSLGDYIDYISTIVGWCGNTILTNPNFKEMKSWSLAFVLIEGSALLVWDWVNTIDLPKKGVDLIHHMWKYMNMLILGEHSDVEMPVYLVFQTRQDGHYFQWGWNRDIFDFLSTCTWRLRPIIWPWLKIFDTHICRKWMNIATCWCHSLYHLPHFWALPGQFPWPWSWIFSWIPPDFPRQRMGSAVQKLNALGTKSFSEPVIRHAVEHAFKPHQNREAGRWHLFLGCKSNYWWQHIPLVNG